jgi:hypothetical protein
MPSYIPEGYEVQSATSNKMYKRIVYTMPSNGDKLIVFTEYEESNDLNIDTEDADYVEKVTVNGSEVTLTTKDGMTNIVWSAGNNIFNIYGTIPADEIVRIAESVET